MLNTFDVIYAVGMVLDLDLQNCAGGISRARLKGTSINIMHSGLRAMICVHV